MDVYDGMDNQAMFWQLQTIQAFHSIVPGSLMEFYPTIGVQRDVASRPDTTVYGLRGLTSCEWLFDPLDFGKSFTDSGGQTLMPGWSYYATQNGCNVYRNDYYIPMGFSYDSYVSRSEYNTVPEADRHLLLLKAVVLDDNDVVKYSGVLSHLATQAQSYSQEAYYTDCAARKATSCSSFSHDNGGFSATFTSSKSRLVFFSVPYEDGWSATVNGKSAQIAKVNVGFMAVEVPAGTSSIRFNYQTPGAKTGAFVALGGGVLFLLYLFLTRSIDSKKKRKVFLVRRRAAPAASLRRTVPGESAAPFPAEEAGGTPEQQNPDCRL